RPSRSLRAHRMAGPCPAPGGADARAVPVVPAPDPAHGSVASAHRGPLAAAHLAAAATHRLLRRRRRDRLAGRRGDAVLPTREAARSRPSPSRAAGRGDPGRLLDARLVLRVRNRRGDARVLARAARRGTGGPAAGGVRLAWEQGRLAVPADRVEGPERAAAVAGRALPRAGHPHGVLEQ